MFEPNLPENMKVIYDELVLIAGERNKFETVADYKNKYDSRMDELVDDLIAALMENSSNDDAPSAKEDCNRIFNNSAAVVFDELCNEAKVVGIMKLILSVHRIPVNVKELKNLNAFAKRYKHIILSK